MAVFSTERDTSRLNTGVARPVSWLVRERKRAVHILIAAPLFFVVIEICARLDDKIRYDADVFCDYNASDMLYTRDQYGRCGRPYGRFEKWQLNSYGFRAPEIQLEKRLGVVRIACMGASETFGYYESAGGEWPAQLQQALDRRQPGRYEVINTALAGYLLSSNTVNLERRILRFSPDVVILYQSFFDYLNPHGRPATVQGTAVSGRPASENSIDVFSLKPRSVRKAKPMIKSLVPQPILRKYQIWRAMDLLGQVRKQRGYDVPIDEVSPERLDELKKDLHKFERLCTDADATVVVATHAYYWNEYTIAEAWRYMPYLTREGLVSAGRVLNQWLREVAAENQIVCVDIARTVPANHANFVDYAHFTDAGAKRAAEAFAEAVLALHLHAGL